MMQNKIVKISIAQEWFNYSINRECFPYNYTQNFSFIIHFCPLQKNSFVFSICNAIFNLGLVKKEKSSSAKLWVKYIRRGLTIFSWRGRSDIVFTRLPTFSFNKNFETNVIFMYSTSKMLLSTFILKFKSYLSFEFRWSTKFLFWKEREKLIKRVL